MKIKEKIKSILMCLALTLSLTACSLPFLGGDNEEAKKNKPKGPDEIFSFMLDKMNNNLKTADYSAVFNIDVEIDSKKLSQKEKNVINEKILSFGIDRPHVLGIDNSSEVSDNNVEADEDLKNIIKSHPEASSRAGTASGFQINPPRNFSPSPSIFNFGKEKIDVEIEYSVDGKIDKSDEENIKGESNLRMDVDLSGMVLRFDFESKVLGEDVYFKINKLPAPLSMMIGVGLEDKWWNIDLNKLEEEQKKEKGLLNNNPSKLFAIQFDKEKTEEIQKELEKMIKKHNIFKVTEVLAEENIENNNCFHYKIDFNKNILKRFLNEFYNFADKAINESFEEAIVSADDKETVENIKEKQDEYRAEAKDKLKDFFGELIKVIRDSDIEVWIDKDEYFIRKTKFDIKLDFKDVELENLNIDKNIKEAISININGEVKYSNINKEINIEAPIKYESFLDYISGIFNRSQIKARDSQRVADVKQIQRALELYFEDNNKYPESLKELEGKTKKSKGYFISLPENPEPNDNDCAEDFEYYYKVNTAKDNYQLKYCLGMKTSVIPAGNNTATKESLYKDKDKDKKINKNTDSDLDGLFDWEEIEIYGSDPKKSDTDGDGYLDGDEVDNGYNPAGEGELPENLKNDVWKSYEGEKFNVKYPANWEIKNKFPEISEEKRKESGITLQLISPYGGGLDRFRENILISLTDLEDSSLKTIDDWNSNLTARSDYDVLSSKKVKISGFPGIDFEYYNKKTGENKKIKTKMREMYFIKNGIRYSMLFSGEPLEGSDMAEYEKKALKIMNSFSLK